MKWSVGWRLLVLFIVLSGSVAGYTRIVEQRTLQAHGQVYYHNESGVDVGVAAADEYANITVLSGFSCFGMTCGGHMLNITIPGTYSSSYHLSFGGSPNKEYHATIGVNGVDQDACHGARLLGSGGDVGNMGGTCLLDLDYGDVITIMVENEDTAAALVLQDSNFNLVLT